MTDIKDNNNNKEFFEKIASNSWANYKRNSNVG